jgi:hypothetical protein
VSELAAQTHGSALAVENGCGIAARRAVDAADRRSVLGTKKPRFG